MKIYPDPLSVQLVASSFLYSSERKTQADDLVIGQVAFSYKVQKLEHILNLSLIHTSWIWKLEISKLLCINYSAKDYEIMGIYIVFAFKICTLVTFFNQTEAA